MKINVEKSCLLYCNMDNAVQNSFASSMPYRMLPLHSGFTYLGYFLKPLGYRVNDWIWLLQKFEKRISNWTFQFLSLGFVFSAARMKRLLSTYLTIAVYGGWLLFMFVIS